MHAKAIVKETNHKKKFALEMSITSTEHFWYHGYWIFSYKEQK